MRAHGSRRRVGGTSLPKQFSSFGRERTFPQATVDRLQRVIAPERTVVVVARQHESLARQQLSEYPELEIVLQPRNLGTGPGVLLPLVHVLRRALSADVALVPSDHAFRSAQPLQEALLRAQRAARQWCCWARWQRRLPAISAGLCRGAGACPALG